MRLAQARLAAFAVNYRLSPPGSESTFPAQLDDVRTAVRWVRANAASHRVDSRRVGTLGGSAGGNLALLLGTTGTAGDDRVEAVVSWSGPTDLRAFRGREPEILLNYMGCPMAECPDLYEQASPIAHVDRSTAPTYLANGSDELIPADQARGMDNALREAGVQSVVRIVDGEHHSRELEPFVWAASVDFLGAQLRPAPAPSQPGLLEQPLFWFVLTGAVLVGIGAMRLLARR